ncbi:serine hydrolase domain-containing protein [Cohnella soli]|uniref:Serine hydrolase domain-containing protein n=1 Tax=Cohnella soli TaxID=425005 RepID=A0ABW0I5M5_9BACL
MPNITETIEEYLKNFDSNSTLSGTVLISKQNEILISKGYGKASYELGVPNYPNSKFRIGSITKTFTAVSVLQLVEKGLIGLDDCINRYFPTQQGGDKITISNLLSHTSGIQSYTDSPLMIEWSKNNSSPDEIFKRFSKLELNTIPGTEFSYSNSNYCILGMLIEKITDQPYDRVLKETIFDALGMYESEVETPLKIIKNLSSGYELDLSKSLIQAPYLNTTNAFASGDILSTAADLHIWDEALHSDKLITSDLKSKMYKPFLEHSQYGFGWFVQDTPFGKLAFHSGGITGYSSMLLRFLDSGVTVIVLNNVSTDISELSKGLAVIAHGSSFT